MNSPGVTTSHDLTRLVTYAADRGRLVALIGSWTLCLIVLYTTMSRAFEDSGPTAFEGLLWKLIIAAVVLTTLTVIGTVWRVIKAGAQPITYRGQSMPLHTALTLVRRGE